MTASKSRTWLWFAVPALIFVAVIAAIYLANDAGVFSGSRGYPVPR